MRPPPDLNWLPAGAEVALAGGIGRHSLEDFLIVPSCRPDLWLAAASLHLHSAVRSGRG